MNTYLIGIGAIITVMYFKDDINNIFDSLGISVRGNRKIKTYQKHKNNDSHRTSVRGGNDFCTLSHNLCPFSEST